MKGKGPGGKLTRDQRKSVAQVDATEGTPLHALNRLREDALPRLLDDLMVMERKGLEPQQCNEVKTALGKLVNAATGVPDGGFLKPVVWKEFERFERVYHHWNSKEGPSPEAVAIRKEALKKLRQRRHRIVRAIRHNQYVLANELDLQLITASYAAFAGLTKAVPEVFVNLSKAVARFGGGSLAVAD
jgi:hypothetical protein